MHAENQVTLQEIAAQVRIEEDIKAEVHIEEGDTIGGEVFIIQKEHIRVKAVYVMFVENPDIWQETVVLILDTAKAPTEKLALIVENSDI